MKISKTYAIEEDLIQYIAEKAKRDRRTASWIVNNIIFEDRIRDARIQKQIRENTQLSYE